jgi:hypothetical protein
VNNSNEKAAAAVGSSVLAASVLVDESHVSDVAATRSIEGVMLARR